MLASELGNGDGNVYMASCSSRTMKSTIDNSNGQLDCDVFLQLMFAWMVTEDALSGPVYRSVPKPSQQPQFDDQAAVLSVLLDESKNLLSLLVNGLDWTTFTSKRDLFKQRFGHLSEVEALIAMYLNTDILLCWFHVKAAWLDNLLTKVCLHTFESW